MKLVLDLIGPPRLMGARSRCELRSGSLTIGRSPEADWVIPDMDRAISRRHLRIDASQDRFVLTDTSSNGVYVNTNDVPVGYGASVTLRNGDALRVGEAQIAVTIESASEADPAVPNSASSRLQPVPVRDPLGGPFGSLSSPDLGSTPQGAGPAAPRQQIIDANWMIQTGPEPPPQTVRSNGDPNPVQQSRTVGRAAPPQEAPSRPLVPPTLLAIVERHPELSARRLAEAVDAATQTLDASVRQALHHKINLIVD